MLAQNFKTTADLGITDAEIEALIKVLGMLERGELKRAKTTKEKGTNLFHMGEWGYGCGTPACIGGYVALLTCQDQAEYVQFLHSGPLHDLYWGPIHGKVSVEQAAIAQPAMRTGTKPWLNRRVSTRKRTDF